MDKTDFSYSLLVWQIVLIALLLGALYYTFLHKRKEAEHPIPVLGKILIFIPSLTWAGIIIGLYIWFRKKQYNNLKQYKFSRNSRFFGTIITLVSIICTLAYYTNKNNPFQ